MRIYYDPISTTSRPVTLMVADNAIPVELEAISILTGEQHHAAFRTINPKAMVPVLVDGSFVLTEVSAILMYLARHYAPELYPDAPQARARIDEMVSWFSTDVHLALDFCTVYPRTLIRDHFDPACAAALASFAAERVRTQLVYLDGLLQTRRFVAGESISIADYLGYSFMSLAELIAFDFAPYAGIVRWLREMAARSGRDTAYAAFDGLVSAHRLGRVS